MNESRENRMNRDKDRKRERRKERKIEESMEEDNREASNKKIVRERERDEGMTGAELSISHEIKQRIQK